jgi:hypothetical protein
MAPDKGDAQTASRTSAYGTIVQHKASHSHLEKRAKDEKEHSEVRLVQKKECVRVTAALCRLTTMGFSLSLDKNLGDVLIAAVVVFSGGALYLRSEHQATKRFDAAEKLAEKREKAATQHIDDVKDATNQRFIAAEKLAEERENVATQHIDDVKDALIQRIDDVKDATTQRFIVVEKLAEEREKVATQHIDDVKDALIQRIDDVKDAATQRFNAAENLAATRHDAVIQRLVAAENLATTRHDADGKLADVRSDAVTQRIDDLKVALVPAR